MSGPRVRRPRTPNRIGGMALARTLARTLVRALGWALLPALLLGACSQLPESGPVHDADVAAAVDERAPSDINVAPPAAGASPLEVARGFLDAMTASPVRVDVAREYLTKAAAAEWDPAAATITYGDQLPANDTGGVVTVPLADAELIDGSGAWQGRLTGDADLLHFAMSVEGGEFRINNPRNALIVPESWFQQRYGRVNLYFFDRSGSRLVPEPVFQPRGDQFATSLVAGLLRGPGRGLADVVRSYLPGRLRVGLSVPVDGAGVADVALVGNPGALGDATVERLYAQLAWTLRQDSAITGVRVSVGGAPVDPPEGDGAYPIASGARFSPVGYGSTDLLYGLAQGRLAAVEQSTLRPLDGPFSTESFDLVGVTVAPQGQLAAGTTADGRLLVARVRPGEGEPPRVHTPIADGTDLLRPHWDLAGRVWTIDATGSGAVVRYVEDDRAGTLHVAGISGQEVRTFLVSRDGTRLIAVVREDGTDTVRAARIEVGSRGRVVGATAARVISDDAPSERIRDIGWASPTTIVELSPISADVYEVRTISVDGAPLTTESVSTTVTDPVVGLATTPVIPAAQFAVRPEGLFDLGGGGETALGPGVSSLGYAG